MIGNANTKPAKVLSKRLGRNLRSAEKTIAFFQKKSGKYVFIINLCINKLIEIINSSNNIQMPENKLNLKTITELLGMNFYIPDYQRGYRWTKENVTQLLDDIWEYRRNGKASSFYCLQPIVVKKTDWKDINNQPVSGFELIDGQQRLTTLHRIVTYLQIEHLNGGLKKEGYQDELFSMYYQTRLDSRSFLDSHSYDESMPDLYYMSEAYRTIKYWFEEGKRGIPRHVKDTMLSTLLPSVVRDKEDKIIEPEWSVKVIWYEIREDLDNNHKQRSEDLFKRLNRGKIPLTSAELIKAKFVNSESLRNLPHDDQIKKKTELIQIWDEIEVQLNDPSFWSFITNKRMSEYSNKIQLLFDTITGKKDHELDPLYSFLHFFNEEETSETLWQKWIEVEELYRALLFWYKDKNYYHKIGYLIEMGTNIRTLIDLKKRNLKSEFDATIDELIAETLPLDWETLSFDKKNDKDKIAKVLLLHNLEKIRQNNNIHEFFPFEIYKNIAKSLEHIHAQNIEDIDPNNKELWKAWLLEHISILKDSSTDDKQAEVLIDEVQQAIPSLTFSLFTALGNKILALLPQDEENNNYNLHNIENMALLGLPQNITLSNSVFEVKRRKIVELDKNGAFLPVATKRIFLKYYSNDSKNGYSVWTKEERLNYKADIRQTLNSYLTLATNNIENED